MLSLPSCLAVFQNFPRIVLAQLEGSGRGALAAYNQSGYSVLSRQLQEVSLRDPDAWMDDLVRKDKGIGAFVSKSMVVGVSRVDVYMCGSTGMLPWPICCMRM